MATLVICGNVFDAISDDLRARTEIMVEDGKITAMGPSTPRPSLADVVDLSEFTILPQMIVPGLVPARDTWRELWLLVQSGVAAARVLQSATIVAAGLIGRDDLGALAPGKTASMIGVRGNPLDDISVVRQPDFIMIEGRILRRPSRRSASTPRHALVDTRYQPAASARVMS